jgi:hypothetical protein
VIRDYANSGVGGDEQTDQLFQLAYAKYQVRRFVRSFSPMIVMTTNCANALS